MSLTDVIDRDILRLLQENARTSVSQLAGAVNLSVPAASERLKKLEASGVIQQYTAILDAKRLNKALTAIMFISLERPRYNEPFVEAIRGEAEVLECHYLAGDYDYSLKIVTQDTETLEQLLNRVKSVKGVQKTKTSVVLSTVKRAHSVSPD